MVDYGLYLTTEQYDNTGETPRARIIRYKKSLIGMRDLVLFQISQPEITHNTLKTLERDLSDIIGGIDKLRHVSDIDDLIYSIDGVLVNIRKARKCLNVASGLIGRTHRASSLGPLYDNFEEFADYLLEAIHLFKN